MQTLGEILKKKDPKTNGYVRLGFLDAWISAMMATKAFEIVIDAGKPVNGDNLAAAMRSVKNWDTGGLIDVPVTMQGQQIGLGRVIRFNPGQADIVENVTDWLQVG
jgi:branched-chain amino acid transport system substrate-binding protein